MNVSKKLTMITFFLLSMPYIAKAYDKVALADDISKIKSFTQTLSNTDVITFINSKIESDHTGNQDIAEIGMIMENYMLTTAEKENTLLNVLSLEKSRKERCVLGFASSLGCLFVTILLVAVKNGGF